MTKKEYEDYVLKQCKWYVDLNYCVIALNEEAGEVAGWYKKVVLRNNPKGLTEDDLKGELGDVLFYLTCIARVKGWSLNDIMEFNKAKLDDRVAKNFKMVC